MVSREEQSGIPRLLWLILLLALGLRIAYLVVYSGMPDWSMLTVDNHYHHNWAVDIADGDILGDTTYFRAPLYVFALAAMYALFGVSLWTARIFGLAIGVVSVAVTYALGTRAVSRRVGLIAAALHAIWPTALYFEAELLLDPLFLLLVELTLWRLLVWLETDNPRDALIMGICLGLASITRPTALALLVVVGAAYLMKKPPRRRAAHGLLLATLGLLITIGPIFARNVIVARDPVTIASQGGINLYIGNNEAADGVSAVMPEPLGFNWQIRDIEWIAEKEAGAPLSPGEVSSYWSDRAVEWIAEHPADFVRLYLIKLYRNISTIEISNNRPLEPFFARMPLLRRHPLTFGMLFAFALAGIVGTIGKNRSARLLVMALAVIVLVSALFFFNSRFRLPLLPLYFVLAAAGAMGLIDTIRRRRGTALLLLAALVGGGLLSSLPLAPLPPGASPQALMAAANDAYARGDYRSALDISTAAARVAPTFPEVNLNIANAYVRLGDLAAADRFYQEEARLHPGRAKAFTNLASLALVQGDLQRAQSLVRIALTLRPYDYDANLVMVRSLAKDSALSADELVSELRAAAARTDDDIYLLNEAAIVLTERGPRDGAREFLLRALETDAPPIETDDAAFGPNFRHSPAKMRAQMAQAAYQLGFIAGTEGRFEEAIERSREAIAYDSTLAEAWVNLISGYVSAGRAREADSALALSLTRFPGNPILIEMRRRLAPIR